MEAYHQKLLHAAAEADNLDKCFKTILTHITDAMEDVDNLQKEKEVMTKRYEHERDTRYLLTIVAFFTLYLGFFIGRYISPK